MHESSANLFPDILPPGLLGSGVVFFPPQAQADVMLESNPTKVPQALAALARIALLVAIAFFALRYADLSSLLNFRPAPDGGPEPTEAPFLVSDFRRIPCVMQDRKRVRVRPLNTAIDRLGPGVDGLDGAGRPLDGWDKLDHWSMGYWSRFDNFLGCDY
jgi:hypothetical protein